MVSKLDETFRFHETALRLRAQRQQVLASNLANADTPNYKARDFNFAAALSAAMSSGAAPNNIDGSAVAPLGAKAQDTQDVVGPFLQYRKPTQPSADGNTVDTDTERNQFADNALRYEASLTVLSAQIHNLLAAVQG